MGQKQSATANWSVDDWAYGTGDNVVQIDEVMVEAKKLPEKYFGGKAIESDASMHQMQNDLLSFDDTLKRLFFWRKKNKRSKKEKASDVHQHQDEQTYDQNEEYAEEDEQYFDESQEAIPEEDSSYAQFDENPQTIHEDTDKKASWRCKFCAAENKFEDIKCHHCKETETRF